MPKFVKPITLGDFSSTIKAHCRSMPRITYGKVEDTRTPTSIRSVASKLGAFPLVALAFSVCPYWL